MSEAGLFSPLRGEVLAKYLRAFTALHCHRNREKREAPHKPILLLALLHLLDDGTTRENCVAISPQLVAAFRMFWRALVPANVWQERMAYPFRHLSHEGWWELVKDGERLDPKAIGNVTSIGQLARAADGARFTPDLWKLLQDSVARDALRKCLFERYFKQAADSQPAVLLPAPTIDPLTAKAERLIEEAKTRRFRLAVSRSEAESDVAFVRHGLFPRVVKALYEDTCAVCRLSVRTERGRTLVDAAHIVPFSESHNDDPRNGLALCKNHHWGFDQGWYSLTDEYTVLVSPALRNVEPFVLSDAPAFLPALAQYAPAKEALAWHRENKLLR